MTKIAERDLVGLAKHYGWKWHKYGDVRYCIHCSKPLPKTERAPDYLLAPIATWVECKNSVATGRWNWKDDIGPEGSRQNQRLWLKENDGWLFITLGTGRAPKGRGAWLLPWRNWEEAEDLLINNNQASLRLNPKRKSHLSPRDVMEDYVLQWGKGGWRIPRGHIFWAAYNCVLHNEIKKIAHWRNE